MRRSCVALAAFAFAFAVACAEPSSLDHAARSAVPREIVPRLVVSDSSHSTAVLTLALDIGGAVGRIGSFTARVLYDSTALEFIEEVPVGDGALRAMNPAPGLVRIAGASAQGMDAAKLAQVRFKVNDPAALALVRLELDELHEQTRADLKVLVKRVAGTVAGTKK